MTMKFVTMYDGKNFDWYGSKLTVVGGYYSKDFGDSLECLNEKGETIYIGFNSAKCIF